MLKRGATIFVFLTFFSPALQSHAGEADVVRVEITRRGGVYYFDVTLRHADTGWEHYADWWRVKTVGGKELARRTLAHPHVDEQPFTRGLGGVRIPGGVYIIIVEGHDLVHKYGGQTVKVDLSKTEGEGYRIGKGRRTSGLHP